MEIPNIHKILPGVLGQIQANKPSLFTEMTRAWDSLAGEEQSRHSEPYALRGKILFVRVDDSSRAFELSRRYKASLIRRLKHALGEDNIEDIVFRVGELSRSKKSAPNRVA